jgi:hypothetical protein
VLRSAPHDSALMDIPLDHRLTDEELTAEATGPNPAMGNPAGMDARSIYRSRLSRPSMNRSAHPALRILKTLGLKAL